MVAGTPEHQTSAPGSSDDSASSESQGGHSELGEAAVMSPTMFLGTPSPMSPTRLSSGTSDPRRDASRQRSAAEESSGDDDSPPERVSEQQDDPKTSNIRHLGGGEVRLVPTLRSSGLFGTEEPPGHSTRPVETSPSRVRSASPLPRKRTQS